MSEQSSAEILEQVRDNLRETGQSTAAVVLPKLAEAMAAARDVARDRVAPQLAQQVETARGIARDQVAPKVAEALTAAADKMSADQASQQAEVIVLAAAGEPVPGDRRRRWPFFLSAAVVGAAAVAVAKVVRDRRRATEDLGWPDLEPIDDAAGSAADQVTDISDAVRAKAQQAAAEAAPDDPEGTGTGADHATTESQ